MATSVAAESYPLPSMALPPQTPPKSPITPENMYKNQLQENMYKNQLQEYTQKSGLPFPVYHTVKEGPPHAPLFKCTVWVNGKPYTTPTTFPNRKAAEQGVARALLSSCIPQPHNAKEDTPHDMSLLIHEDTTFCKSILNEYATKQRMEKPAYNTIQSGALLPAFTSSVVLNGINYTGVIGRNKKEAEQLAARAAILSVLESVNGNDMYEVVKSKLKLYAAISGLKEPSSDSHGVPVVVNVVNAEIPNKRKQDGVPDGSINLSSPAISVSTLNAPFVAISGLKEPSSDSHGVPVVNVVNAEISNKRKQDGVADGSINLSSPAISVSTLNAPFVQAAPASVHEYKKPSPAISVSTLNTSVQAAPVHEYKKPKVDAILSTASPLITFVPASSQTALLPSVSCVKQSRKRKKSRKRSRVNNPENAAVVVPNPVSQLPG